MILVTLGTQKFQMNRLVQAADEYAATIEEEVFIQTGHSTYEPQHARHAQFVDAAEFQEMIRTCSVLVTHSGVGSIITGVNAGRPVVVVPSMNRYKEHVDDHQVQIAKAFAGKGIVLDCEDVAELPAMIEKARTYPFKPYVVAGGKIEDIILDYIKMF